MIAVTGAPLLSLSARSRPWVFPAPGWPPTPIQSGSSEGRARAKSSGAIRSWKRARIHAASSVMRR